MRSKNKSMTFPVLISSLERLELLVFGVDGQKEQWTSDEVKSIMKEYHLGSKLKRLQYVGEPADRARPGLPEHIRHFGTAFVLFGVVRAHDSGDPLNDFVDAGDFFGEVICKQVFKSRMINKLRWVDCQSIPQEEVREYALKVDSLGERIYSVFENFFMNEAKRMLDLSQKQVDNNP